MTPDEVRWIELELGLDVPEGYRALVTAYPAELYDHVADYDLLDDPAEVVLENRDVREAVGGEWPLDFFAIGHDGLGNTYCLDLAQSPPPVIFFDRGTRSFRLVATSLEAWWPELVRLYEDPDLAA